LIELLNALAIRFLNLLKTYTINYIDINRIDSHGSWPPTKKENPVMRIVSTIARYLAGVIFLIFGLNGFLNFIPMPPPGGIAGQFMGALYASHYLWVIFAFQVVAAVLLLANRFVPLAVAMLAPVIVNILSFHALMAPNGLPLALFVALLWVVIFVDVRPAFAGLFQSRLQQGA
jgi:putative oxidoreductase